MPSARMTGRRMSALWGELLLGAAGGVAIAFVTPVERKGRQPGFGADGPQLVGRLQLVRRIQRSQVHFNLVAGACEHRRAAAGAERSPGKLPGLALDRHSILGK